jgi:glutathione peroxidase
MIIGKKKGKEKNLAKSGIHPVTPLYNIEIALNSGQVLSLQSLQGKKLLVVNTASDCGYTDQYKELQQLQEQFKDKLVVIGFPANDFKEQEKGTDEAIAQFCQVNYGVTFPLAKKSSVVPSSKQHPVFLWLSNSKMNGWNNKAPEWNFSKYLVNEKGMLTHYFHPGTSPLSAEVINAVQQ